MAAGHRPCAQGRRRWLYIAQRQWPWQATYYGAAPWYEYLNHEQRMQNKEF